MRSNFGIFRQRSWDFEKFSLVTLKNTLMMTQAICLHFARTLAFFRLTIFRPQTFVPQFFVSQFLSPVFSSDNFASGYFFV